MDWLSQLVTYLMAGNQQAPDDFEVGYPGPFQETANYWARQAKKKKNMPMDQGNPLFMIDQAGNPSYGSAHNVNPAGVNNYHRMLMNIQDPDVPGIQPGMQWRR